MPDPGRERQLNELEYWRSIIHRLPVPEHAEGPRWLGQTSTIAQPRVDVPSSEVSHHMDRRGVGQQHQCICLSDLESILGDNSNMLSKMLEELRLEVHQNREEILKCLNQKAGTHSYLSLVRNAGPGVEGLNSKESVPADPNKMLVQLCEDVRQELVGSRFEISNYAQQSQQDLLQMKQMLVSIQQEVRSSKVQAVDYDKAHDAQVSDSGHILDAPSQKEIADSCVLDEDDMGFWKELQIAVKRNTRVAYEKIIASHKESIWHVLFRLLKSSHLIRHETPDTYFARMTEHRLFLTFQTVLILCNTCIMGYETDLALKAAMQDPKGVLPGWFDTANLAFNTAFTVELVFRICALRTWFFVAPQDWAWNFFDVFVVLSSIVSEVLSGVNLSFLRTFRILRVVRSLRLVRLLRFFAELRKILVAIFACLASLAWCLVFLFMTMYLFTILLLQGISESLDGMERGSTKFIQASDQARQWYGSVFESITTLLGAVTIGHDFFVFKAPLEHAGFIYVCAYVFYILFVTVGVMNVLTGVFLSSADQFQDRSMVIQNEEIRQESFVRSMTEVFEELDLNCDGILSWDEIYAAMESPTLASYLQAYSLTATHARFLFDLLDEHNTGRVPVHEFVMGMLRLKGEAKVIDGRVIQRQITLLPKLFSALLKNHHALESSLLQNK